MSCNCSPSDAAYIVAHNERCRESIEANGRFDQVRSAIQGECSKRGPQMATNASRSAEFKSDSKTFSLTRVPLKFAFRRTGVSPVHRYIARVAPLERTGGTPVRL